MVSEAAANRYTDDYYNRDWQIARAREGRLSCADQEWRAAIAAKV